VPLYFCSWFGSSPQKRSRREPCYPEPAIDLVSNGCRYDPAAIHTVNIRQTTDDENWKTEQKRVWGSQKRIAIWLNLITAAAALFTGAYVVLTYNLWKEQVESHKAWVSPVDPVALSFTYDPQSRNVALHARTKFKNFGQAPAFQVYGYFGIARSFDELMSAMRTTCEISERWS
jgi:hypothetical protein